MTIDRQGQAGYDDRERRRTYSIETRYMKRPKARQVSRRGKSFDVKRTKDGFLRSISVGDPGHAAHSTYSVRQNNPRGHADAGICHGFAQS